MVILTIICYNRSDRNVNLSNQQESLNQRRGLIVIGSEGTDNNNDLFYSGVSADTNSADQHGASAGTKTYSMSFLSSTIKHRNRVKHRRHKNTHTILDSGATGHIFSDRKPFLQIRKINDNITVGDRNKVSAIGRGDIQLTNSVRL